MEDSERRDKQMKKIAAFGGTFNPIHNGHIHLCLECGKHYQFEKILLIPTNLPPHKTAADLANNYHRLEMCRLAAEDYPLLEVSDLEMKMSGVSYTVNTVRELRKLYPDYEIYLIIGSDMLFMFHKWYCYQEILENVHLLAGAREPKEYERMTEYVQNVLKNHEKVHIIHIPVISLSSTFVRESLKKGERISEHLNPKVYEYIVKNRLYSEDIVWEK